ncbi:reverse transcriptase family protein [Marimonas arenosa]|uniref:RNA-directed DNA polymerase n=1 Tax=Marimonas arenosa TaxID=1795305 RepID=A0AAE4B586_9RHOB|nr:reverse transcriptase family protein [Marimonas arenosa]MDQ2091040.1 reverse transcriptase family protein [Marimonas arenosa]
MNFKDFSTSIAATLTACDWTPSALADRLQRLLPPRLHHHAAPLAATLSARFPKAYAPRRHDLAAALRNTHEMAAIWHHARQHQTWPAPETAPPRFLPLPAFRDLGLPSLSTRAELADWLGLTPEQLTRFADLNALSNRTENAFAPHYRFHILTKASGGERLIEEPKPLLKRLQRRLLSGLLNRVPSSPAAYGFVPGRNCLQAAARHAGEAVVLRFDLREFFNSIAYSRVFGLYRCLGYPGAVASDLTGLTTLATPPYILHRLSRRHDKRLSNRHLPQGAPTSPALANLCAHGLDRRLDGLARRFGAVYTRYADDLTFSGDAAIARPLLRILPEIAENEGFALNPAKTGASGRGQRQTVTGLVINRHLNIPRPAYDRLKATVHHLSNPADPRLADPAFLARLSGQITWLEQVNPPRGAKLRERLARALDPL